MNGVREQALMVRLAGLREQGRWARFLAGLSLPLQAVRVFLRSPRLLLWAIVPAMINLVLFAGAVFLLIRKGGDWLSSIWARPELVGWGDWLWAGAWWLVFAVVMALGVVLSYFFVLIVGGFVASPFNDALSVRVETLLTGKVADDGGGGSFVSSVIRGVLESIATFALFVMFMAPLLGLHLVPVVGSVAYSILAPVVSMYFLMLEYTGGVLERHGFLYRERMRVLLGHRSFAIGYGVGAGFLIFVPVVNLVAMPILVVAGTIAGLSLNSWTLESRRLKEIAVD